MGSITIGGKKVKDLTIGGKKVKTITINGKVLSFTTPIKLKLQTLTQPSFSFPFGINSTGGIQMFTFVANDGVNNYVPLIPPTGPWVWDIDLIFNELKNNKTNEKIKLDKPIVFRFIKTTNTNGIGTFTIKYGSDFLFDGRNDSLIIISFWGNYVFVEDLNSHQLRCMKGSTAVTSSNAIYNYILGENMSAVKE